MNNEQPRAAASFEGRHPDESEEDFKTRIRAAVKAVCQDKNLTEEQEEEIFKQMMIQFGPEHRERTAAEFRRRIAQQEADQAILLSGTRLEKRRLKRGIRPTDMPKSVEKKPKTSSSDKKRERKRQKAARKANRR